MPLTRAILLIFCLAAAAGCSTLGERVDFGGASGGSISAAALLDTLAENDARLQSFRAAGSFTIESPEFDSVKRFRGGRIMFRRPQDLYVQGNHRITNMTLFRLVSVGEEFLMEFPTDRDQSFYQLEGEQFEDVPFTVSPAEIALEMFLPESWDAISRREIRVLEEDVSTGTALLEIGPRESPRRRVQVALLSTDEPAWVVVRNERLDEAGAVLAVTELHDYHALDGVLFPSVVDAWFPTEETRMRFEMRNIRVNVELPDDDFRVRERAEELRLAERSTR